MTPFLRLRGHWPEWAATQRTALAAATRLGDPAGQAVSSRLLASACSDLRRLRSGSPATSRPASSCTGSSANRLGEAKVHHGPRPASRTPGPLRRRARPRRAGPRACTRPSATRRERPRRSTASAGATASSATTSRPARSAGRHSTLSAELGDRQPRGQYLGQPGLRRAPSRQLRRGRRLLPARAQHLSGNSATAATKRDIPHPPRRHPPRRRRPAAGPGGLAAGARHLRRPAPSRRRPSPRQARRGAGVSSAGGESAGDRSGK